MVGQPRGIDHLVVTVRDLDAAGAFYESLGFTVGARNRHPWGTANRIVQFDGSFIELITVGEGAAIAPHGERTFSFGAFVRDSLARGEGLTMLVLESRDAPGDALDFAASGIGDFETFFFERHARRPDGAETTVAFTLAFARDDRAPQCGFFVCQQHFPENFWNPAFQRHANGARGVAAAVMTADNPTDHHIFLSAFTGQRDLHATSLGVSAELPRGRLDILSTDAFRSLYGAAGAVEEEVFVAYGIAVDDLAVVAERLARAGIAARMIGPRLVVAAEDAYGVTIAFETAARGGGKT
ncbi:VOC family protein [Chelatococcus asaccharovorans]|uniref:Glyoxalase-like protein n=1 Tax=Chelatococcus asaccharovorans TaxID=28210 RepID=A0A2V3UBG4_9HYPH|nr:VOC family protein [Chelatococcus asaccharovorans]MBS7703483.1 VOC family protein [Chelatococcus asaccharovorans]PXW61825.1 glyoxalase-like protein [Chelatococcus asaccharovorans]